LQSFEHPGAGDLAPDLDAPQAGGVFESRRRKTGESFLNNRPDEMAFGPVGAGIERGSEARWPSTRVRDLRDQRRKTFAVSGNGGQISPSLQGRAA
jgi:hypothetical protein